MKERYAQPRRSRQRLDLQHRLARSHRTRLSSRPCRSHRRRRPGPPRKPRRHSREDFPTRNDESYFKHSLVYKNGENDTRVEYKDVDIVYVSKNGENVPKYPLEVRKY